MLETFSTNSLTWDDLNYEGGAMKDVHYGLIHQRFDSAVMDSSSDLIPFIKPGKEPKKCTLVKEGDLILADASEDVAECGEPVEFSGNADYPMVSGLHTIHCRDKTGKTVAGFKSFLFGSLPVKQQIARLCEGTKIYSISNDTLRELWLSIPEKEEQAKIVSLLKNLDERIHVQRKNIEELSILKVTLQENVFKNFKNKESLKEAVELEKAHLYRGKIIPKHPRDERFKYPVYSSSQENLGLMGYWDTFMLDEELISWSIDGGGKFFYRPKHKFNITNVCGYMRLNLSLYDCYFCYLYLDWQFKRMSFDYVSKAHPSVIQTLYSLPTITREQQSSISKPFKLIDQLIDAECRLLTSLFVLKRYLLKNTFC